MEEVVYLLVEVDKGDPNAESRCCLIAMDKESAIEWEKDTPSSPNTKRESMPIRIYKPRTTQM